MCGTSQDGTGAERARDLDVKPFEREQQAAQGFHNALQVLEVVGQEQELPLQQQSTEQGQDVVDAARPGSGADGNNDGQGNKREGKRRCVPIRTALKGSEGCRGNLAWYKMPTKVAPMEQKCNCS